MKTITIRQPWANLIIDGIKDIENRSWKCPEKYIGKRILIHVSKKGANFWRSDVSKQVDDYLRSQNNEYLSMRGCIIGSVEIIDCVINHSSIWAEKSEFSPYQGPNGEPNEGLTPTYNWVLANPIKFKTPIPAKGKLSFWDYNSIIEEI
jgi:hypothetical protein